jgi:hypothetical protein
MRGWTCLPVALALSGAAAAPAEIIFTVAPDGPSGLATHFVYAPGPIQVAGGDASGLVAADEINSFSQATLVHEFLLCFSVDPESVGAVPPLGSTFNVFDQAAKNQEAGDAFITTVAFDRAGPISGAAAALAVNNVLALNQAPPYSGGFFGLMPAVGPGALVPVSSLDDVDGGGTAQLGTPLALYYTFDLGSPKLAGGSAADIWYDPTADRLSGAGGDESVFATALALGLVPGAAGDAIASLSVFDDNQDGAWNGTDQVLISLEPGSPTLALLGAAPADIISIRFGAAPTVFAPAALLGLLPGDQVDMLELVPLVGGALETIVNKVHLCPQDTAPDCQIDVQDLVAVVLDWGCVLGQPGVCPGDVTFDGAVNVQDLVAVVLRWGSCPEPCAALACPGPGDCFAPHASPGCEDMDCCVLVCGQDSFCCEVEWDVACVIAAILQCQSACPGGGGDCFHSHATPGCGDVPCCEAVCAVDLFCCEIQWDGSCVQQALIQGCGGLINDECGAAVTIENGTTPFTTVGAGTDGPPACGQMGSDVWYAYDAAFTGALVVDTLGSGFDTVLAAYAGCACPAGPPLACNDDVDGTLQSRIAFPVSAGQCYLIRLGGFAGAQGKGQLTVSKDPGSCPPSPNDCFIPGGVPGCNDAQCCNAVCAVDPFCCMVQWDAACAMQAQGLCVPPCVLPCQAGDALEPEACGADTNGGCNASPPAFPAGACGQTWCGTSWAQGGVRDTDWYLVHAPGGTLHATLTSEFPGVVFVVDVAGGSCANVVVIGAIGSSSACAAGPAASAFVAPGSYAIFVAPGNADGSGVFDGFPCGGADRYRVSIQCLP